MEEKIIDSGIDILGKISWGTHFCQFYKTKEDLIEILVPYFKAGLEDNEFCMWITSEPFNEEKVKAAIRKAIPDIEKYLKKGQLEILPYSQWYIREGSFNTQKVLDGWIDKLNKALTKGFKGLRLTGNTFWLEQTIWKRFAEYELTINNIIGNYKMIAICTYSLEKCGAEEILDVMNTHQFALIKREEKWAIIESSELKLTKQALQHEIAERKQNEAAIKVLSRDITEKKKTEQQIKLANAYNRSLIESSLDPLVTIGPDGTITDVNKATERATGLSRKQLVGTDFSDYFTEPEKAKAGYKKVFEQGTVIDYELELRHINGHTTPVMYNASVFHNEVGEVVGVFAAARDITEHIKYQSLLVDNVSDAIISTDENYNILSWNKGAELLIGWTEKEAISKNTGELLNPQYSRPREEILNQLKEKGSWLGEGVLKRKDGSDFYFLTTTTIFYDKNTKKSKTVACLKDISEIKKAQKEIADLAKFPAENPNPVIRVDQKKVLYCNSIGKKIFNVEIGDPIPNTILGPVTSVLKDWEMHIEDLEINDKIFTLTIIPFKDSNYINIYPVDITLRKRAEKKLKNFVSTASHELRTPLTVFVQTIQNLKNYESKLSYTQKEELINDLLQNAKNLSDLVDELLKLSQFDENKVIFNKKALNILETFQNTINLIQIKYSSKNIKVNIDVDNSIQILGDKKRMEELISIFLDNAFKYSPQDSIINLSAIQHYHGKFNPNNIEGVLVKIEDFGIGVPKEDLPHLFDRFFRSKNVLDKSGSGLGLSIAKEIIKLFEGEVIIESELNKGTTIYIFFPK